MAAERVEMRSEAAEMAAERVEMPAERAKMAAPPAEKLGVPVETTRKLAIPPAEKVAVSHLPVEALTEPVSPSSVPEKKPLPPGISALERAAHPLAMAMPSSTAM